MRRDQRDRRQHQVQRHRPADRLGQHHLPGRRQRRRDADGQRRRPVRLAAPPTTSNRAIFTFCGTVTLASIDSAIQNVADARSTFGSIQNRLEHTLNNLANYQENLTSAESRIRDVDMASEMVNFTKLQILQQAGTSMLAQANQSSTGVLSLLR